MLEIVRPPKVEVKIYGDIHELRRISEGDLVDLLRVLKSSLTDIEGLVAKNPEAILGLFGKSGDIMDFLLRRSFPTFKEWDGMALSDKLPLFDLAFTESKLLEILQDFSGLIRRAGILVRGMK
jgi:hypothetical protein